jgi:predicted Zn-dependent peptidase
VMLGELFRLARDAITEEEVDRARNYAAGMVEIQQQSGAAVAAEIVAAWAYGVLDELIEQPQRLRAVTAADIARVADEVFVADKCAEYVVQGAGKSK